MEASSEKSYTWTQTSESLTITIPMKRVPASKVDIYLSETYVKINAIPIKQVVVLDLLNPILYNSGKNRTVMRDDGLELYLLKAAPENWPQLCHVDTKENLKKRREESMAKQKKEEEERTKIAEKKKIEMDKLTLNDHIEMTHAQKKHISDMKEDVKSKAEKDLYDSLEKIENPYREHRPKIEDITEEQEKPKGPVDHSKDIFTADEIKLKDKIVPQSKIREKAVVKLGFTEKKYPLLAARETQLKEPPLPKAAMQQREKDKKNEALSFEERNPLWLKEKGDNFFNNGDLASALNAYGKAIEGNPTFLKCYLNRATAYLKVRAYRNCFKDCVKIEEILEKQKKEEDPEFYEKVALRSYVKKAASDRKSVV